MSRLKMSQHQLQYLSLQLKKRLLLTVIIIKKRKIQVGDLFAKRRIIIIIKYQFKKGVQT
ncbi:hypothetical protein Pint_34290 [Pistacia integerrima]|uniref:Uncharacterized protein n=1 Tax=Pistacia integerrima TaxID=434235 RepID=A0ACC0X990_9ROSI|nr:hypothetical protein Pint_34290 [Pistacia integerrima]